jgi:predicted AlkP superfamily pyrophosphatase or phosphodiesterase
MQLSGVRPSRAAALALVGLVAACASDALPGPRLLTQPPVRTAATAHVVIISIDGLRPDAITDARTPTLWRLSQEGSATFSARTIYPSRTLPSHTSMLTGVTPHVHGVEWNDDQSATRGVVRVPTVFGLARARGLETAAFFSKTKFHHLEVPGTLDFDRSPANDSTSWRAARTLSLVEQYLAHASPNLLFVHVGEPDYAGHTSGWMSAPYLSAVQAADSAVERVLTAATTAFGEGQFTVVVTADHGGHRKTHGSLDAHDMTIPWITWGEGVRGRNALGASVRTMDTAATALWLLGVAVPNDWSGTPVVAAYE